MGSKMKIKDIVKEKQIPIPAQKLQKMHSWRNHVKILETELRL